MKNNESLKQFYLTHKKVFIPSTFLLLSLALLIGVIFPQLNAISESNLQVSALNEKNLGLKNTLTTISAQEELVSPVALTNEALPTTKNISVIFNTLLSAAGESGTQIDEFSLKVGGVYGRAEDLTIGARGVPTIDVIARVDGEAGQIVAFANALQERLPLAEVAKIESTDGRASFQISFFYKPQDLNKLSEQDIVRPLTAKEREILQKLESFQK